MVRRSAGRAPARQLVQALILGAAAAACGTPLMDMKFSIPPDKTNAQFEQDRYECLQMHDNSRMFQACLQARGYKLVVRRFIPVPQF